MEACTPAQAKGDGPYPAHVVGGWPGPSGTMVQVRPIAASHAELIREFVHSLSFETRYLRFMGAVKELAPQTIDRLTRIDHRRDAALIAMVNDAGADRVAGVARYALNADGESCDFAIVVADDWQGHGLGRGLLTRLVDTAAARGVKWIGGDVLAINWPMLALAKALGFSVSVSGNPATRRVRLSLERHQVGRIFALGNGQRVADIVNGTLRS